MTDQTVKNPYIGPRPFTAADRNLFFGRDREVRDLIPLVISERIVLFNAQSGAGKSSLINARLIPGLRERNFIVLPVGRVSGEVIEVGNVENIFVHNLLVSLDQRGNQAGAGLCNMTLAEYLANLEIENTLVLDAIENNGLAAPVDAVQVIEGVQPMALIIDQFEEIFSTHPEAWRQRGPFFEQLGNALEADPYLWIVLAIREDYVAALDPYAYLIPGRLRARYYMQRMEYGAALEAVKNPVAGLRPFAPGVAEELVNNLRRIPLVEGKGQEIQMVESQYVEPVQLQVVCYQLWEQLKDQPGDQITAEDLANLARGGDLAQFISRALAEFYEQALDRVIKDPSVKISERQLRNWFSKELITESETRGSVFEGETKTGSMPKNVVRLLEAQFIVRSENRASGKWYELSHDRFISPIQQANRAWNEHNPRPILADAEMWSNGTGRLYEGPQLVRALEQLDAAPDDFGDLERKFLQASQTVADRQRTRRQRIGIGLLALLVIVLSTLTILSYMGWQGAITNEKIANMAITRVSQQKEIAEQASILAAEQARAAQEAQAYAEQQRQIAEQQRQIAETQSQEAAMQARLAAQQSQEAEKARAAAEAQRAIAAEERDKAQIARNQAEAGRLSSLSDNFRINNLDLSLLLSIEAVDLFDNWNTRSSLLTGIQRGLKNTLSRDGVPINLGYKPFSVAFSPDGELIATGLTDGVVSVMYVNGRARVEGIPVDFTSGYTTYAIAFSSDSRVLAQGNGGGSVLLWDRDTNKVKRFHPFITTFPYIFSLAFQPDGELLAIGTQREQETRKGAVIIYNYKKDRVERMWDCGQYDCTNVAWSPDGKKLAVANKGGSFKIFDLASDREVRAVDRAHNDQIYGLVWYSDNQRLATAGLDRRIILWNTTTGEEIIQSDRLETPIVISMAISPNGGRYLLVGAGGLTESSWASLWDAETLKRLPYSLYQHSQGVSAVAFNRQGNQFATASYDSTTVIWRFEPANPLGRFIHSYKGGKVETLADLGAGELQVSQYAVGNLVNIFGKNPDQPVNFTELHSSAAAFSLNGKPVIGLGGYEGQVTFTDAASGIPVREPLKIAAGSLRSLAVSADGRLLAAAVCKASNQCDQVVLWDIQEGKPIALKNDLQSLNLRIITSLSFSSDQKQLAIGNASGQILFYSLETGALDQAVTEGLNLQTVNLVTTSVAFGPDGSDLLAAGFHDGRIALWQASARYPIGQFDEGMNGEVTALLFRYGADGRLKLVAGSSRGEVREYEVDLRSWQESACLLTQNLNLTPEERKKFLPDSDPQAVTCPR